MTVEEFNELPMLLRRSAVMRLTGLSRDEVRTLREVGRLQAVKLQREFRYHRESVRTFLALESDHRELRK